MKNKRLFKIVGWTVGIFILLVTVLVLFSPGDQQPEIQSVASTKAVSIATTSAITETLNTATTSLTAKSQTPSNVSINSTKAGAVNIYPNPNLTPGDVFSVDGKTVCVSGYTATVRDVPESIKKQVYVEYGATYPQAVVGTYEVDHFIPLEIGGSNDIKNLWLEPALPTSGFRQKDVYENYSHRQVCNGEISLQEAQRRMKTDWYMYYLQIPTKSAPSVKTQATTSIQTTSVVTPTNQQDPAVKKSGSGICHEKGTQYYDKTTTYTAYGSIEACLASGGRLPK